MQVQWGHWPINGGPFHWLRTVRKIWQYIFWLDAEFIFIFSLICFSTTYELEWKRFTKNWQEIYRNNLFSPFRILTIKFYFQESFEFKQEAWFTYILTALAIFMGIMMGGQLIGQHFSLLLVCKFSSTSLYQGREGGCPYLILVSPHSVSKEFSKHL